MVIRFGKWNEQQVGLSQQLARDFVELFYRGSSPVTLHAQQSPARDKYRGLCMYNADLETIDIFLDPEQIRRDFGMNIPCGGTKRLSDFRAAVASVLAHESQHANQYAVHSSRSTTFFGTQRSKYENRACERDARMFADDSFELIHDVLQIPLAKKREERPVTPLEPIAIELAAMDEEPTNDDLKEELRSVGMNNPVAMAKLKEMIRVLRDPDTTPEAWANLTGSL